MSLLDERLHDDCDLEEFLRLFKDQVECDPFGLGHRLDNYWFETACYYDNLEVAQWLYKNSGYRLKLNGLEKDKSSCALVSAIQGCSYKTLRWLLTLEELDVNVKVRTGNLVDSYEGSSIDYAIHFSFPEDIIIAFIQRGTKKLAHENLIISQMRYGFRPSHFTIISQLLLHGANSREESERSFSLLGHMMVFSNTAYDFACYNLRLAEGAIRLGTEGYNADSPAIAQRNSMEKICFALKHWETSIYMHCFNEAGIQLDVETISMLSAFCEQTEYCRDDRITRNMIPVFEEEDEEEEEEDP